MDVCMFIAALVVFAVGGYHIEVSDKRRRIKRISDNHNKLAADMVRIYAVDVRGSWRGWERAIAYHRSQAELIQRSPKMYFRRQAAENAKVLIR